MTDQEDLFDLEKGEQLKEEGMAVAAMNRKEQLEVARGIAKELALSGDGTTSADLVAKELYERHGIETLGPAAGSLFRGDNWHQIGYRKTTKASSHARPIGVWRWVA